MKYWMEALKGVTMLAQFGLSLVIPILLCLGLCRWITVSTSVGGWVYIPGFILGLGSSAMTAWKFYLAATKTKGEKDKEKKKGISFNRHM